MSYHTYQRRDQEYHRRMEHQAVTKELYVLSYSQAKVTPFAMEETDAFRRPTPIYTIFENFLWSTFGNPVPPSDSVTTFRISAWKRPSVPSELPPDSFLLNVSKIVEVILARVKIRISESIREGLERQETV